LRCRYGIRAFDTSVYYGPSEIVLGNILHALQGEFPRSSYKLVCTRFSLNGERLNDDSYHRQMTKCGRYGVSTFDYSPTTIRESVKRSLERLKTDYLDTVYLHDVEFVATPVAPRRTGNHTVALGAEAAAYGLDLGNETKIWGEGDQKVLDGFHELQKLKEEGLVKNIGITGESGAPSFGILASLWLLGFPLPTLLRLSILILHTAPYKPVDVLLSYSHLCLQNSAFLEFIPHFYERAKIGQLLAASPLSMALLTSNPPSWHPAPLELRKAVVESANTWEGDYPNLAVGYSVRQTSFAKEPLPLVVGFSTPKEVHESVKVWREVQAGSENDSRQMGEETAREVFRQAGFLDWSWASPGP